MVKIDTQRSEHMHALHRKCGLRLDDAAKAADYVVQAVRDTRDIGIRALRKAGLSAREIAEIFGISHVHVLRLVRSSGLDVPPSTPTLSSAA